MVNWRSRGDLSLGTMVEAALLGADGWDGPARAWLEGSPWVASSRVLKWGGSGLLAVMAWTLLSWNMDQFTSNSPAIRQTSNSPWDILDPRAGFSSVWMLVDKSFIEPLRMSVMPWMVDVNSFPEVFRALESRSSTHPRLMVANSVLMSPSVALICRFRDVSWQGGVRSSSFLATCARQLLVSACVLASVMTAEATGEGRSMRSWISEVTSGKLILPCEVVFGCSCSVPPLSWGTLFRLCEVVVRRMCSIPPPSWGTLFQLWKVMVGWPMCSVPSFSCSL